MGSWPQDARSSFAWEKGRDPMNAGTPFAARFAESGEGWVEARQYLWVVAPAPVATMVCSTILMACAPQARNTTGWGSSQQRLTT